MKNKMLSLYWQIANFVYGMLVGIIVIFFIYIAIAILTSVVNLGVLIG